MVKFDRKGSLCAFAIELLMLKCLSLVITNKVNPVPRNSTQPAANENLSRKWRCARTQVVRPLNDCNMLYGGLRNVCALVSEFSVYMDRSLNSLCNRCISHPSHSLILLQWLSSKVLRWKRDRHKRNLGAFKLHNKNLRCIVHIYTII